MTTVRKASQDDVYEILVLAKKFFKESKFTYEFDIKALEENLRTILESDKFFLNVIDDEGEIVGFLAGVVTQTLFSPDQVASELAWYVTPSSRGQKSSLKLMSQFEEWSKEVGAKFTCMSDIDPVNDLSDLYERKGYVLKEKTYVKEN